MREIEFLFILFLQPPARNHLRVAATTAAVPVESSASPGASIFNDFNRRASMPRGLNR
jgi:hypothetical protein